MKWIDELEKIKGPDPEPVGTDDANVFLWGVKKAYRQNRQNTHHRSE